MSTPRAAIVLSAPILLVGVLAQIPMKGILYWNSHAFNLTDEDTTMHARLNYYFASSQRYPIQPIFNINAIFNADAAPYTTQTICNDQQLPQGARLFELSSTPTSTARSSR